MHTIKSLHTTDAELHTLNEYDLNVDVLFRKGSEFKSVVIFSKLQDAFKSRHFFY